MGCNRSGRGAEAMRLLFHIGTAKTGSSALQSTFARSARYLAGRGVLFPVPRFGLGERNHKLYASQCAAPGRLPRHMSGRPERLQARFERFHATALARVAERRPDLVLLSSESLFFRLDSGRVERFRAVLAAFGAGPPGFVAYLRRPSEHYLSLLQQGLKAAAAVPQPGPPRLRRAIAGWQEAFGPDSLALHLFYRSALEGGDVVDDFVARHLAPYGVEAGALSRSGEVNVSLGPESILLMQAYRARFHGPREDRFAWDSNALRRALQEADAATGAPRPRLRPGIAELIDHGNGDALWLRDRFGIAFPGLDYRQLEAGPRPPRPDRALGLEEIVETDPERRAAILEHLAGTLWGRLWPSRRRWIEAMLRDGTAKAA
jgi:hypothetical protein